MSAHFISIVVRDRDREREKERERGKNATIIFINILKDHLNLMYIRSIKSRTTGINK